MAPHPFKNTKPRGDFDIPLTSNPKNGGDFVLLNEEQRDAEWVYRTFPGRYISTHSEMQDGDQTKYIPPTLTQSLTASMKIAVDGMMNEPLTKENLLRNTSPLAQDLGTVTKHGLGVAAGWAGQTLVKIGSAAAAYGQAMTSSSSALAKPPTGDVRPNTKAQPNLSGLEENAITSAVLNGRLRAADKDSEEVKAFLANFRKGQGGMQWTAGREADASDDEGEMEEIDLGKPFVEDPDVVEDLQPGGESGHESLIAMTS
ncbi:MAG: hypothetical protein Q9207_004829 [Kuettlingeria erythrocarpa]